MGFDGLIGLTSSRVPSKQQYWVGEGVDKRRSSDCVIDDVNFWISTSIGDSVGQSTRGRGRVITLHKLVREKNSQSKNKSE